MRTISLMALAMIFHAWGESANRPKECIYAEASPQMFRLDLPIAEFSSGRLLLRRSADDFASVGCGWRHVKAFVAENERPVMVSGTNITSLTVEGDICGPSPKFVMTFPEAGTEPLRTKTLLSRIYPGLYPNGRRTFDFMAVRVAAAIAVTKERCGSVPDEMRFVGRTVDRLPADVESRASTGKIKTAPFHFNQFFSGRVFPKKGTGLITDDPDQEARYWAQQRQGVEAAARAEAARQQRFAIGAALGMLILGASQSLPCYFDHNAIYHCDPDPAQGASRPR